MAKYYAVRKGKEAGIFVTWAEAEMQVKGFPEAEFKSFSSKEQAEEYLSGVSKSISEIENLIAEDTLIAYVDGSFDSTQKIYGSGVVILNSKREILEEFSFSGNRKDYVSQNQIGGELEAALKAMQYSLDTGYSKLVIYFDFLGIKNWVDKSWRAESNAAKDYVLRFELYKQIEIEFIKVAAHTGDEYNERADRLAKNALTKSV